MLAVEISLPAIPRSLYSLAIDLSFTTLIFSIASIAASTPFSSAILSIASLVSSSAFTTGASSLGASTFTGSGALTVTAAFSAILVSGTSTPFGHPRHLQLLLPEP